MKSGTLRIVSILMAAIAAFLVQGCPEPEPPVTYMLTVTVTPEAAGTVTAVPAASETSTYEEGETVILAAVPAEGYSFSSWTVDDVAAGGSYGMIAVEMTADKAVTATFTEIPAATYSLTVNVSPVDSGTVAVSPVSASYASGSSVSLTATPASGYAFSGWSGDATGSTNPKTLTMDGNKVVTAEFLPQNPGGSIQEGALTLSGTVTTLCGSAEIGNHHFDGTGVGALFNYPQRAVLIGTYLYIADTNNHRIRRLNTSTGEATTFAGSGTAGCTNGTTRDAAQFNSPVGLATDGTDYLYVSCIGSHTIARIGLTADTVDLIAGTANTTGNGNEAVGTLASFDNPNGLAYVTGSPASLFVADQNNHLIRKITLTGTFAVTTLAGITDSPGSTDGAAGVGQFDQPMGLATDGTVLWVADHSASTIREVVIATGAVTTRAGVYNDRTRIDAAGTSASFNYPFALILTGTTLYIVETGNDAIRTMTTTSPYTVTTLTGSLGAGFADGSAAAARFNEPSGLAISGTTLYVVDRNNSAIRKVNTSTKATTTFAGSHGEHLFGNGTGVGALLQVPVGMTPAGPYLYATDHWHTIRRLDPAPGAVTTISGAPNSSGSTDGTGTSARFSSPTGITIAGDALYVCDTGNQTIRKIEIDSWEVSTFSGVAGVAGSADGIGEARFNSPRGITSDGAFLYVTDASHIVRKISLATQEVTTIAGMVGIAGTTDSRDGLEAQFNTPQGITTDGLFLYVCDSVNYAIRTVDLSTGEVSTLAGLKGTSSHADGVGTTARFRGPYMITCDGEYLYVTDTNGSHTVRSIEISSREVDTIAGADTVGDWADGTGTAAYFNNPEGITTDGENLYVCDYSNHVIRKIE
jgi:uncharacterized repeat protein (TIGR02543 family)